MAASELASARISGYFAGLETDADAIVALAKEAYATAPSYQTRSELGVRPFVPSRPAAGAGAADLRADGAKKLGFQ